MPSIQRWGSAAIVHSLILMVFATNNISAQETVSFTVTNGAEIRCAADSTVNITISPNLSDTYSEIGLVWGDGTVETILPNESLSRSHTFSTYQFLEECAYECAINPLINGFCFNISIIATYDNITDENASKIIAYKIPPRVMFLVDDSVICEGDEICFSNATCPSNDDDMVYTWDFGNGTGTTTADTCIVYPTAGTYSVTLTATNTCGSDSQVQLITVLGLPTAEVSFTNQNGNANTTACTPYSVSFMNESVNGTSYQWEILQGDSSIIDSTTFTVTPLDYTFTDAGIYTVRMTTRSECGEVTWEEIFTINESPTIILAEQTPACETLTYIPDVFYGGGIIDTYTWTFEGGTPSTSNDSIPTGIVFNTPGLHLITLEVESPCGIETASINVEIQLPAVVSIDPVADPFCNSPDSVLLVATPAGGVWTGAGIVQDSFFISSQAGEGIHELTYTFETGVCTSSDMISVEVFPQQAVDAGQNIDLCIEDAVEVLQGFSPPDGQWSGMGIISNAPPTFDPSVAGVDAHDLIYTFIDEDGCLSFDIIVATVEAIPVFELPDTLLVCNIEGDIDLGSLANVMPSPPGGTVLWEGVGIIDNTTGLFNSAMAGASGSGAYEVSYSYTTSSAAACQLTNTLIVHVIEPTEAIAQPDESLCITEGAYFLTATPEGGQWTGPGIVDAATGEIDLVLAGGSNAHSYVYTIFEGSSCEMSDITIIEIIDFAGVDAGQDLEVCQGETSVQLTGSDNNSGIWTGTSIEPNGLVNITLLDTGLHTFVYTLSSETVANCATADELQLRVIALPEIAFSVDSACVGATAQFINETLGAASYLWDFGTATSTLEHPVFIFNTAGDFPVTLTAFTENAQCENLLQETVSISQPPELVAFMPVYQDSCAELDISLTNGSIGENLSFLWYEGENLISEADGPIALTLSTGRTDTTYYFRLEVANNCGGEAAIDSVRVSPSPVSFFGVSQNNYCAGETVQIINISYGNPISYLWDFGDPLIPTSTDSVPPEIFYQADSTITRTITLITSNECGTDTLSRDILIHPAEVVAFFNIEESTVCVGDSICFTNFSTYGADLVYDFGDGNTTTDANPCHAYQEVGVYTVELTATACGFDNTLRTITVIPKPDLEFYAPPLICLGEQVAILDSSQNVSNYSWGLGDGTFSSVASPTHVYNNTGSYIIALTAEASNGCQASLSSPIEVVALPQAAFTSADSLCAGAPLGFNNNSLNASTCFWDFGDGNFSSDCSPTHSYAVGDSSYIATLVVTNAAGCMDTLSGLVFIRAVPVPDFEFDDNLCSPALIPFTNLSQYADSYQWTFSNGMSSSETNPSILFEDDVVYTATLQATNDGVCTAVIEKEISLYAAPSAAFTPSVSSICAKNELTFNNQSTGDITSQRWTFGLPGGIVSFDDSPVFTFSTGGLHTIELIVNTDFCSDTIQQVFDVFEAIEASFITTNLLCFEEPTGFIDVSVNAGTMPFQYDWSNGAVAQDISQLPAGQYELNIIDANACQLMLDIQITQPEQIITQLIDETIVSCFGGDDGGLTIGAEGGTPAYSYSWNTGASGSQISNVPAGDYEVSVTDANGCVDILAASVSQNPPISIVDKVTDISCFDAGDGEILVESITGGSPIFNLTLVGPVNYQSVNRRFGELLAGSYQLTVEDSEGCSKTYEYEIEEPDSIFVNILQGDTAILLGEYVDLTSDFNAVEPIFSWNPTTDLDCTDCYNPEAFPFYDVVYEITMTDANNCVVQDDVSITVDRSREVFIPDAFTPNGDGYNDVFRVRSNIKSIDQIEEFTILDRWGTIMFQAENYPLDDIAGEWNGDARDGNKADAGVYVWYAIINFVDGKSIIEKGDVTLLR